MKRKIINRKKSLFIFFSDQVVAKPCRSSRKKVPVQRAGSASSITGDAIEKESEDDYTVVPSPPAKKRRRITKEVATEPESTEEQDLDQNHDGSDHGEDQTMREGDITGDLDGSQHEDEEHDMHVEGGGLLLVTFERFRC